jgi:hypothetical protein
MKFACTYHHCPLWLHTDFYGFLTLVSLEKGQAGKYYGQLNNIVFIEVLYNLGLLC